MRLISVAREKIIAKPNQILRRWKVLIRKCVPNLLRQSIRLFEPWVKGVIFENGSIIKQHENPRIKPLKQYIVKGIQWAIDTWYSRTRFFGLFPLNESKEISTHDKTNRYGSATWIHQVTIWILILKKEI